MRLPVAHDPVAEDLGVPFHVIVTEAPAAVVRARLERRAADPNAVSDADWNVFELLRREFEAPDELRPEEVIRIDTASAPPEQALGALVHRLVALRGYR